MKYLKSWAKVSLRLKFWAKIKLKLKDTERKLCIYHVSMDTVQNVELFTILTLQMSLCKSLYNSPCFAKP